MSAVTSPAAPERTLKQRREALDKANMVRSRRADLKRTAKAKRDSGRLLEVLADPPVWAENMKVFDLVMAMPKVGRVKVNRLFAHAGVSPSKTVGGLSGRQRSELVTRIATRSW